MTGRLKAGDLAVIVGCVTKPTNVGKSCRLVQFCLPGEVFCSPLDSDQRLRLHDVAPCWVVVGETLTTGDGEAGWTICRPEHLRPLEGPDVAVATPAVEMAA